MMSPLWDWESLFLRLGIESNGEDERGQSGPTLRLFDAEPRKEWVRAVQYRQCRRQREGETLKRTSSNSGMKRSPDWGMGSREKDYPAKRQKKKKKSGQEAPKVLDVLYPSNWQNSFARNFVIEEPNIEEGEHEVLLEKLKKTKLLNFFLKTCAVMAPRDLIAHFILGCKVEQVSTTEAEISYQLPIGNKPKLQLTQTTFGQILELASTGAQLTERSNDFYDELGWLSNKHVTGTEVYWTISEITDPGIRALCKYLTAWVFRLANGSRIYRQRILPVYEALRGKPVDWTHYLWPKFVSAIETLKIRGKQGKHCKCSVAGLISAILYEHTTESGTQSQPWDVWLEKEAPDKIAAWNAIISRLGEPKKEKEEDGPLASNHKTRKTTAETRHQEKSKLTGTQKSKEISSSTEKDVQEHSKPSVSQERTLNTPPSLVTDVQPEIGSSKTQEINDSVARELPLPKVPAFGTDGLKETKLDDDKCDLGQSKIRVEGDGNSRSGAVQKMIQKLADKATVSHDVLRDLSRYNGYVEHQLSMERKKVQDLESKLKNLQVRNQALESVVDQTTVLEGSVIQLERDLHQVEGRILQLESHCATKKRKWRKKTKRLENLVKELEEEAEHCDHDRRHFVEKMERRQKDMENKLIDLELKNRDLQSRVDKDHLEESSIALLQQELQRVKNLTVQLEEEHSAKKLKWSKRREELESQVKELKKNAEHCDMDRKILEDKCSDFQVRINELQTRVEKATVSQSRATQLQEEFTKVKNLISMRRLQVPRH